jgi:hypothetical protein
MAVWDLKRVGRTTVNVRRVTALIALGHAIIGPGAAMSAVRWWRECALAKTSFLVTELNTHALFCYLSTFNIVCSAKY